MNLFETQPETRARLDAEAAERAYAELAASVSDTKHAPTLILDDLEQADGAIRACLRYVGAEPDAVPEGVEDFNERLECLCRSSGTAHRAVSLDDRWYKKAFGALLGTLDTGKPIALLPNVMRGYYYLEPGSKRKVAITPRVAKHISKQAVLFYKPLPARKLRIRDLALFIAGIFDLNDYALVFFATLVATLIGLLPAWANNIAFNNVVPSGMVSLIIPIAALLVGVTVSSTLIGVCRNLVMARLTTKLNVTTEAATFARLLVLPPTFFKKYASGDLASRVSGVSTLAQTIVSILLGAGLSAVMSIVYILQVAAYAPALALPALCIVVFQAVLTTFVTLVNMRYERITMQESAKLSGMVTALLGGVQKIKLAGAEERAFAQWAHGYAALARATYNRPTMLRALPALVSLVGTVGNIAIYFMAGSTHVSVADYMSFNVAFGQATGAIMALAGVSTQVAQVRPQLEMVGPILESEPEIAEGKPSVSALSGQIEVSNLSFRYDERAPYVVKDLSFTIRPGEYVAIVGKSGCGKSTIVRLLLGFEKPERGSIMYGRHDVSTVDLRSLRSHIGTVMQNGGLFASDIESNITIAAPTATVDDAWEAAELAGVAADIRKMPMGMQTMISEGSGGVSGGQRQRLLIARAVCGNRRILIFDEATSALDNVTQKHVSDALAGLRCTRLVIAHRLSTVRECDRILVLDGGRIVEQGSYEELMARDGLFAQLAARQRLEV
ncbi:MAG: ATP-binding cassette domain-containing protein [Atopobiaceae bacterium]|nr:ATP-binding cassette domain-containing protein [Atopobiaceae bacterium]